jgi:hypothetical protein
MFDREAVYASEVPIHAAPKRWLSREVAQAEAENNTAVGPNDHGVIRPIPPKRHTIPASIAVSTANVRSRTAIFARILET